MLLVESIVHRPVIVSSRFFNFGRSKPIWFSTATVVQPSLMSVGTLLLLRRLLLVGTALVELVSLRNGILLLSAFFEMVVDPVLGLFRSGAIATHLLSVFLRLLLYRLVQLQSVEEILLLVFEEVVKGVAIQF